MRLYIIGNGFDLHHGLKTRYTDFGIFLRDEYNDVFEHLQEFFGFDDLNPSVSSSPVESMWNDFENNLGALDVPTVLEAYSDSLPNYGSDEFRDRDYYTYEFHIKELVEIITTKLFEAFR
ncbi:AbiH family protein, partial [Pseudomonas sp. F1_0610]|uniref:AbiH family protein n=1 Tax=Pseudomonas sp. F1_0610 TaxID=3114284 RepID=UPI0039C1D066